MRSDYRLGSEDSTCQRRFERHTQRSATLGRAGPERAGLNSGEKNPTAGLYSGFRATDDVLAVQTAVSRAGRPSRLAAALAERSPGGRAAPEQEGRDRWLVQVLEALNPPMV